MLQAYYSLKQNTALSCTYIKFSHMKNCMSPNMFLHNLRREIWKINLIRDVQSRPLCQTSKNLERIRMDIIFWSVSSYGQPLKLTLRFQLFTNLFHPSPLSDSHVFMHNFEELLIVALVMLNIDEDSNVTRQ